jgi:hypothetical protein
LFVALVSALIAGAVGVGIAIATHDDDDEKIVNLSEVRFRESAPGGDVITAEGTSKGLDVDDGVYAIARLETNRHSRVSPSSPLWAGL